MDLRLTKSVLYIILLTGLVAKATNATWQLCLNKCYHLSTVKVPFSEVNVYCKDLSPQAKPVDFGMKGNESISLEINGSCNLNKLQGENYWVNSKFSVTPYCRTIQFSDDTRVLENQYFPCTNTANPFCEADESLCRNMVQQSQSEWGAVENHPPYYHASTSPLSYCEAVTYCEDKQTHLAQIDKIDYNFLTKLWSVLKDRTGYNFIVWIFTKGIRCPAGATIQATAMSYFGAIVHMAGNKSSTEGHLALCSNPFIPTTTTSTTTKTSTTTTPTTETTTSTAPTTTSTTPTTTSTTPTTTSTTQTTTSMTPASTSTTPTTASTSPATTSTTPTTTSTTPTTTSTTPTTISTTPATTSTTPATTSTTPTTTSNTLTTTSKTLAATSKTPTTTSKTTTGVHQSANHQLIQSSTMSAIPSPTPSTTLMHSGMKNQIAVSQKREPLWLKTGDHEYFINYDCIKKKCPISCSSAKQHDGRSFCDSYVESFEILPAPTTYLGNDFWIGGRVTNTDILCDDTIQFEKYEQRSVQHTLSKGKVQELWQELRKQHRSNRMSRTEL